MKIRRKGIVPRTWRKLKRLFLYLFAAQLVYIVALRWVNPPITLTMAGTWFHLLGSDTPLRHPWVSYARIAPSAGLAVLAGEDQLFTDHNGFDFKSIEKAWKHNRKGRRIRGASTISQQTAKNVFLWQGRSWFRKGLEAYFTFMIELLWGKRRILEVYLNVAQTGEGLFGVEAASQAYFGKSAARLSAREAALIAACLPNPVAYDARRPSGYVRQRQQWILGQMRNLEGDPDVMALLKKD